MKAPAEIQKAFSVAKQARRRAHAPYSKFKVGAALVGRDGTVFQGCNVENASYGGTVCAERIAIFKAVSEGQSRFTDIVVVTDVEVPAFPCAFCLQVMAEFFDPATRVWTADLKKIRGCHEFRSFCLFRSARGSSKKAWREKARPVCRCAGHGLLPWPASRPAGANASRQTEIST